MRLHYMSVGEGDPIVFLHGASSSLREFTANILHAISKRYRVIVFDRPGFGYSQRPNGPWVDPAHQARLLNGALRQLDVERPLLVGHSWAGAMVLAYLLDHPNEVAGGVLLAGLTHPWEGGVKLIYYLAGTPLLGPLMAATVVFPIGQIWLDRVAVNVFSPDPATPGHVQQIGALLALRPHTFLANAQDIRELSDYLRDQQPRYPMLGSPLLLITGDSDPIVPAAHHSEKLVKEAPNASMVVLENTGHLPHHSEPQRVVEAIMDFARRLKGEGTYTANERSVPTRRKGRTSRR